MMEHFKIAIRNMFHSKLRTWLTMLGIFVGIAGVVALIGLGNGLQTAVHKEFETLGLNRIMVQPAGSAFGPLSGELSTVKLTEKDIDSVRKASGVKSSGGFIIRNTNVIFKEKTHNANIFFHAVDQETLRVVKSSNLFKIEKGRDLRKGDIQKVSIGWSVAHEFFDREISPGEQIEIFGQKFEVVGTQKKVGSPIHDGSIRIPLEGAKHFVDISDQYNLIIGLSDPNADVDEVAKNIEKKLRSSRNVKEGSEDFSVQSSKQILNTVFAIFGIIQAVVVAIAAISLVVGAIGIMNTMYTAVLERTKDIGVMKAIGAKNSDITLIFLIESGSLGFVGGLIGIALGLGVANIIALIARQALASNLFQVSVEPSILLGILAFSFVIGAVSGVLPALQAANLKPVDALRYE